MIPPPLHYDEDRFLFFLDCLYQVLESLTKLQTLTLSYPNDHHLERALGKLSSLRSPITSIRSLSLPAGGGSTFLRICTNAVHLDTADIEGNPAMEGVLRACGARLFSVTIGQLRQGSYFAREYKCFICSHTSASSKLVQFGSLCPQVETVTVKGWVYCVSSLFLCILYRFTSTCRQLLPFASAFPRLRHLNLPDTSSIPEYQSAVPGETSLVGIAKSRRHTELEIVGRLRRTCQRLARVTFGGHTAYRVHGGEVLVRALDA